MATSATSRVPNSTTSSVKRERRVSISREMQVHTQPGSNVSKLRGMFEGSKSNAPPPVSTVTARRPKPVAIRTTTAAPVVPNGVIGNKTSTYNVTKKMPTNSVINKTSTNSVINKTTTNAGTTTANLPSNKAYLKQHTAPKVLELNSFIKLEKDPKLNVSITDKTVDPHTRFACALNRFKKSSSIEQLDQISPTHESDAKIVPGSPAKKAFNATATQQSSSTGNKENKPVTVNASSTTAKRPTTVNVGSHVAPDVNVITTDNNHKQETNSNESSPTKGDLSKNRKNNTYNANFENERLSPKTSPRRSPVHGNRSASDLIALQGSVNLSKELNLDLEGSHDDANARNERLSPLSPRSPVPLSKKFIVHGHNDGEALETTHPQMRNVFRKYSQEDNLEDDDKLAPSIGSGSTHTSMSDVTVEEREITITPKTAETVEACLPSSRLDNTSSEDIEFADYAIGPDDECRPLDTSDISFQSPSMEDLQKAALQEALRPVSSYSEQSDDDPISGIDDRRKIALSMDATAIDSESYEEEDSMYTDQDISKCLEDEEGDSTEDVVKYGGGEEESPRYIELVDDTGPEDESMEAMDEENSADDTDTQVSLQVYTCCLSVTYGLTCECMERLESV